MLVDGGGNYVGKPAIGDRLRKMIDRDRSEAEA
jgi:hypothetical protein